MLLFLVLFGLLSSLFLSSSAAAFYLICFHFALLLLPLFSLRSFFSVFVPSLAGCWSSSPRLARRSFLSASTARGSATASRPHGQQQQPLPPIDSAMSQPPPAAEASSSSSSSPAVHFSSSARDPGADTAPPPPAASSSSSARVWLRRDGFVCGNHTLSVCVEEAMRPWRLVLSLYEPK